MGWARNVERMRENKNLYRLLVGKPKGNLLEYPGVRKKILLNGCENRI
jgi:hypothetical protein